MSAKRKATAIMQHHKVSNDPFFRSRPLSSPTTTYLYTLYTSLDYSAAAAVLFSRVRAFPCTVPQHRARSFQLLLRSSPLLQRAHTPPPPPLPPLAACVIAQRLSASQPFLCGCSTVRSLSPRQADESPPPPTTTHSHNSRAARDSHTHERERERERRGALDRQGGFFVSRARICRERRGRRKFLRLRACVCVCERGRERTGVVDYPWGSRRHYRMRIMVLFRDR